MSLFTKTLLMSLSMTNWEFRADIIIHGILNGFANFRVKSRQVHIFFVFRYYSIIVSAGNFRLLGKPFITQHLYFEFHFLLFYQYDTKIFKSTKSK